MGKKKPFGFPNGFFSLFYSNLFSRFFRFTDKGRISHEGQFLSLTIFGCDADISTLFKEPANGSGLTQIPAVLREDTPHLGDAAVAVVSDHLYDQRCPLRAIALVLELLNSRAFQLANATQDPSVDPRKLVVKEAFINEAPRWKRWKAGPMGRVRPIIKRNSHIHVVLSDTE